MCKRLKFYLCFWGYCLVEAVQGSIKAAYAAAAIPGMALLLAIVWFWNLEMPEPHGLLEITGLTLGFAVASTLTAWAAIVAVRFLGAPARMLERKQGEYAALSARAEAFAAKFTKKLRLSFHPDEDGIDAVPVKYPIKIFNSTQVMPSDGFDDTMATYLRARVNSASSASVFSCTACITRLQKETADREICTDIQLRGPIDLNDNKIFDVHPNIYFPISFVSCIRGGDRLQLPGGRFVLDDALKEVGTYRFTIKAIGEGVQDEIVIAVVWCGQWDQIKAYEVLANV